MACAPARRANDNLNDNLIDNLALIRACAGAVGPGCSTTIGHSRDFAPLRVMQLVVLAELPHVSVARIDNLIDKSARTALRP
jgi:hypothetical protein